MFKIYLRSLFSVSGCLVFINTFVMIFLWWQGLGLLSPNPVDLVLWGGNLGPLTLISDPWRLFSSMFLHGGLLHLCLNMILLMQVGPSLELLIGKMRFITTYLLSGLAGSLVSAFWFSNQAVKSMQFNSSIYFESTFVPTVSVGASGAIMGITATALVCSWWKSRHPSPHNSTANMSWTSLAQVVILNVGMGFFIAGVDNACHIGGVAMGALVGGIFLPQNILSDQRLKRNSFVFVLAVGLIFLWFFYQQKHPEELVEISNSYRYEVKQIQREKDLIKKKAMSEKIAVEERKKIPQGLEDADATGISYVIESGGPIDFKINEEENKAYVVLSESNSIQIIDLPNMQLIETIQGPQLPKIKSSDCFDNFCLGRGVTDIVFSKNGKWALVSSLETNKIVKLNLENNRIEWSIEAGEFPKKIILSPNEKWAFVLNGHVNKLAIIDLENRTLKENPFLSEHDIVVFRYGRPFSMALSTKTSELFIVDTPGSQILVLDANNPSQFTRSKKIDSFTPIKIMFSEEGDSIWVSGLADNGLNTFQLLSTKDFSEMNDFVSCSLYLGEDVAFHSQNNWFAFKSSNERSIRIVSILGLNTVRVMPATTHNTLLQFSKDSSQLFALSIQKNGSGVLTKYDVNKTIDVDQFLNNYYEAICWPPK
jgi:rhomboid protease GluP